MKIVLTTSPADGEIRSRVNPSYVLDDFVKYPPLALLSIIRNIDKKHELILYDSNDFSFNELVNNIIKEKPDLLGISTLTERFYGDLKLASVVKRELPETKIIAGGPHTDLYPYETMSHPQFDYLLNGPCELTFPLFVDWLDNNKNVNLNDIDNLFYRAGNSIKFTSQKKIHQLDGYPFPDRTKIDLRKYVSLSDRHLMTTMNSSRGCPFRCVFCNVPRYYLTRSAPYIVDEIEEILSIGFNEIHILDDTFNINHQRVLDICNLIRKRNLKFRWSTRFRMNPFDDEMAQAIKEAGCFRLNIGVESHDPKILKYIDKKITKEDIIKGFEIIHKYKFETLAFFVIGYLGQTPEEAWKTVDFIKEIRPTFVLINSLLASPDCNFYYELMEKGIFKEDYWKKFVLNPTADYSLPSWRGEEMDRTFMDIRDEIMRNFYLAPNFVAREIFYDVTHFGFNKLVRKIKIGLKIMLQSGKKRDK